MFVYKITNKVNGMLYIGITTRSVHKRWLQHKSCAFRKIQYPLYNAMNKYGFDAFEIETIYHGQSLEEIQKLERHLIEQYGSYVRNGNGYNATYGGDGGSSMPREIIEKVRLVRIGQKRTDEQKKRMSTNRIGKGLLNDAPRKHPKEKVFMAIELLSKGVKQIEIASITGLTQSYISNLKNKKRGRALLGV
jgi:group I intron endonuclease